MAAADSQLFATGVRTSVTDEVIRHIVDLITKGDLKPGDKLPSERELMKQLGVGRSSLREAVSTLSAMGVVEVSVGAGMFVGGGGTSLVTQPLSWGLLINADARQEVMEARKAVEAELASLAAQRATGEEIAAIGAQLEVMRATLGDANAHSRADLEFHLAEGRAAHNRVLYHILDMLRNIVLTWIIEANFDYARRVESLNEHVLIYEAIRNHDAQLARQATIRSQEAGAARLLAALEKKQPER